MRVEASSWGSLQGAVSPIQGRELPQTFLCFRQEREANFAQKKAERATVRSHFRDKYRLPKVRGLALARVLGPRVLGPLETCCRPAWCPPGDLLEICMVSSWRPA